MKLGIWDKTIQDKIFLNDGSVQNIHEIPLNIKNIYKTIWEIKQKYVVDHALYRGPYVDQSQSMNLFFEKPDYNKLSSALLYGWKNGIKTGCYYLRSKPAKEAIKFSLDINKITNKDDKESQSSNEVCDMCSA
jgi:ribonucleotide reductase alpha subunit